MQSAVSLSPTLTLPIRAGQVLGSEQFTVGGEPEGSMELVAATSVGKITLGTKLTYFCRRFVHWLGHIF